MLSVFLITRNEEGSIAETLRSVAPVADELIVVDTGSTDATAAIARQCGAAVHEFPWNDDFSARLLELELGERPEQLYYLIEYGRTLLQLGDAAGHAALAEAARQAWAVREGSRAPIALTVALLEYVLSTPELPADNPMTASEARSLAKRWFPDSPPLLWLAAQQAFAGGDFSAAAAVLQRLVECGGSGRYDQTLSFDPRIIGEDAVFNLAACQLHLANLEEAERLFRRLSSSPGRGVQAQQNLALIARLRAMPKG